LHLLVNTSLKSGGRSPLEPNSPVSTSEERKGQEYEVISNESSQGDSFEQ